MKFRKHFDYDVTAASDESAIDFKDEVSLTVQSMAEDADINTIIARFGLSGKMPENPRVPMYGDFTEVKDFQTALNAVGAAYDGFMELPAKLRARFENDPQKLLEFVADDANIEEARSLGLLKEKIDGPRDTSRGSGASASHEGGPAGKGSTRDEVPAGGGKAPTGGGKEAAGA